MSTTQRVALALVFLVIAVMIVGAGVFARRNLRAGRRDRRGAFRLAGFVFATMFIAWFFGESHVLSFASVLAPTWFGLTPEIVPAGPHQIRLGRAAGRCDAAARRRAREEGHRDLFRGALRVSLARPAARAARPRPRHRGLRRFVRELGRLGIPVANIDFHPGNTYTTAMVDSPRGYQAREFKLEDFRSKVEKRMHDREYSAEEIWANYTYFIKAVLPAAEEANVRLSLHPDDPPIDKMNGVAKVFVHHDGYRRAEQIAGGSRHWGLTFCIGTWSEGGDRMGKNVLEMIRDFGKRGKIFDVHFRNVSSPLPHFVETFPDDGYVDMYQVMKALREVRFNGTVVPDHVPGLVGDQGIRRAGTAYCIAYMRALLRRANEDVG